MKRLVLVRHAKAEQGGYDRDFSRELAQRGRDDAHRLGSELRDLGIIPDYIISSPANRALTTARIFAEETGFQRDKIVEKKGLYFDYSTFDFIEMIKEVPGNVQTLFVFGHNPFMYYIASNLCADFHGDMPTCSTVLIDFNIDTWQELEARQGNLNKHLYPSML